MALFLLARIYFLLPPERFPDNLRKQFAVAFAVIVAGGNLTFPIAVLTGPGALSAGDYSTIWASFHPNARLFGKTTAMAAGLPTQPALGTELILHPEWVARGFFVWLSVFNLGEPDRQKSYSKLDLGLRYDADKKWYVDLFVRNATDKDIKTSAQNPQEIWQAQYLPPRTIGFNAGYTF